VELKTSEEPTRIPELVGNQSRGFSEVTKEVELTGMEPETTHQPSEDRHDPDNSNDRDSVTSMSIQEDRSSSDMDVKDGSMSLVSVSDVVHFSDEESI